MKLQGRKIVKTLAQLLSTKDIEDFYFVIRSRLGHDNHLQIFVKVQAVKRERNYLAYLDQWRKAESNEVEQKGNIIS